MQVIITLLQESFHSVGFYSIHVSMPACGKAKRKTIYPTGGFSIVPMGEKPLDMIKSITDFHRFEKNLLLGAILILLKIRRTCH